MRIRIKRGWRLIKESWAVLRAHPSLLWFGVISGVCALLTIVAWAVLFFALEPKLTGLLLMLVVVAFLMSLISGFFGVALSASASGALEGRDTTPAHHALVAKALGRDDTLAGAGAAGSVRHGLAVARSRFGVIAQWTAIHIAVGVVLAAVQFLGEASDGSQLFAVAARPVWAIASFLVITILALENVGPLDSLKRSVMTLKTAWAEAFVGWLCIAVLGLIGYLSALFLSIGAFVVMILTSEQTAGRIFIEGAPILAIFTVPVLLMTLVAAVIAAVTALIQFAMTAVFRVALYRYAETAVASGPEPAGGISLPSGSYRPS